MNHTGSATGKIILSGEYAMAFGCAGIAFPSKETMHVQFKPKKRGGLTVIFGQNNFDPAWAMYAGQIAELLAHKNKLTLNGDLCIETNLPLGKGMGSSTALVIAIAKALLGKNCKVAALSVEDDINPGHSGMDFAVIWEGRPILFRRGEKPQNISLPKNLDKKIMLIDTGMPSEQTPKLVAWVRSREKELLEPLKRIGSCTERILKNEDLKAIIRDHHRAQIALGVVPPHAQKMIEDIESKGGAGKIIGAGSRTGGGGMILSIRS